MSEPKMGTESEEDAGGITSVTVEVNGNTTHITVKGLDANRYATKKTVAQGMLDIALLTSNASQLKYVLQVGQKHEFYTLLVVLISISIVLQILGALVGIVLAYVFNINLEPDQRKAELLNNVSLGFKVTVLAVNALLSIFFSLHVDMQVNPVN